jgi:hemoglobin
MTRHLFALICALIVGCGSGTSTKPTGPAKPVASGAGGATADPGRSLFERLGGMAAITAVAEEFVNRTTADPRIKHRFFNTDAVNLKALLADFVCSATGGPCRYLGRDMVTAHAGMDLVDDEFTALVENMVATLDVFTVPAKEKNELLDALAALKPQIVVSAERLKPLGADELAVVTAAVAEVKDADAADLLGAAVTAGKRGQRSYAEQLFSRAEMIVGAKPLAVAATVFRAGAPPRVTTAVKAMPTDTPAQPLTIGRSDDDEPDKKPARGSLKGVLLVDGKPLAGKGVVMLTPAKGGKKRKPKQRVIEQREKQFAPHVMAVPVGSTVGFPNFDSIFHNVFSLSRSRPFDLGMFKNGESREVTFDKPGIIRIGCNIHASMSAYLVVVNAPHYVVVEDDGSFKFRSLVPGKYKVQAWSEHSAEPTVSRLEIKPGTNKATLDIKGGASVGPSADKFGVTRSQAVAAP